MTNRGWRWVFPLLLFFLALAAMQVLSGFVPGRDLYLRDTPNLDGSWFVTSSDGHEELYRGLGGFVDHARDGQILILGHSRTMFVFTREGIHRLGRRTGKRFFNLGFSYAEACTFPIAVIQKQGLRPDYLVVNVDGFFSEEVSAAGLSLLREEDFPRDGIACGAPGTPELPRGESWPRVRDSFEAVAASRTKLGLHTWLPRWSSLLPSQASSFGSLRSPEDGSWSLEALPQDRPGRTFVAQESRQEALDELLPRGRAFQEWARQRGTRLIFTLVPSPSESRSQLRALAKSLDVPFIAPELAGLSTLDGSHLDLRSSRIFLAAFSEELASFLAEKDEATRRSASGP